MEILSAKVPPQYLNRDVPINVVVPGIPLENGSFSSLLMVGIVRTNDLLYRSNERSAKDSKKRSSCNIDPNYQKWGAFMDLLELLYGTIIFLACR